MAGEFAKFYIRLGTLFDPKGLKDAETKIGNTKESVSGLSSAFTKLGAMFAGGAAIYKMISFAKSAWSAFVQQEEAVARLNGVLRTQGIYSEQLSQYLQNLASEIQKVTTVGDEDTIALIQLGLSMGIASDKMEEATKQAIGLSKAYGVDLDSAMKMVALATQGEYTMLARYIPQLRTLTDETEKAALVTKLLTDGFELAKAEGETTSGTMKQLANRWGDIQEEIVARAIPAIKLVLTWIEAAIGRVDKLIWTWDKLFKTDEITLAKKELESLNNELEGVNISLASLSRWDGETTEAFKKHSASAIELAEKIKIVSDRLEKLTVPPVPAAVSSLPEEDIAQKKKTVEQQLEEVDKWYISAKGAEETKFYQWLYQTQTSWETMNLAQKQEFMLRAQELYASANATMAGSFAASLLRMKAAGLGWAAAWDTMWSSTVSSMSTEIKTFLTTSGSLFKNFKSLLDGIFESILSSFLTMVSNMIAKWILLQAITGLTGGTIATKLLGSFKEGGSIPETGAYLLHKDEEVIPADIANSIRDNSTPTFTPVAAAASSAANINLTQEITIAGSSETDIDTIAERLSEATKDGVISAVNFANVSYKIGQKHAGETAL